MPHHLLLLAAILLAGTAANGNARADASGGKRLAEMHCAPCHIITIEPRKPDVVAQSPPFDVIGRKYGFNALLIAHAITGPHPKMNFSPQPDDADDIAAYIASLKP
jgi:mono/diheme cytochrome c family protein